MYESTYIVGRMDGKIEGKIQTLQENIAEILTIRFQLVPEIIKTKIATINDVTELNMLLKKAMMVSSIDDLMVIKSE
jgi:hypothetical protein